MKSSTNTQTGPPVLLLAVWFGLATSLAELAIFGARKLIFDETLFLSPQVVWMAPLFYAITFSAVGLLLVLLGRRLRAAYPALALQVLAVGFFSSLLLQLHPRIGTIAILLLALGLAVQTGRLMGARALRLRTFFARSAWGMAGAAVALGIGVNAGPALRERAAVGRLPAPAVEAPNVLLIILDTVRAWSTSLYDSGVATTPGLERIGAEGLVFDRAYAPSSWTTPSHASLFSGKWPHELTDSWLPLRPLAGDHPTLASVLSERGYLTAGFVANVEYAGRTAGLERGFQHFEDYRISIGELVISSTLGRFLSGNARLRRAVRYHDVLGRKSGSQVNRDFLSWIEDRADRPFFAVLNYWDAHEPYLPPEPFASRFDRGGFQDKTRIAVWRARQANMPDKRLASEQAIQGDLDAYEGAIAYLDAQVDTLFRILEARGVLENTVVIVTSDHGEQFGEHGMFDHGNSLYLASLHVPLLIWYPRRLPGGTRVERPVSIRDLAATITDLTGVADQSPLPGLSLVRDLGADGTTKPAGPVFARVARKPRSEPWYPVAHGDLNSAIDGEWQYIRNGDGSEELFDLVADPRGNSAFRVDSARGREAVVRLRAAMDSLLAGENAEGTRR